jgi:hypothetical protein
MRTKLCDHSGAAGRRAMHDHALAEQLHALDATAGRHLARQHDGHPVPAQQVAHGRAGPYERQQVVVA